METTHSSSLFPNRFVRKPGERKSCLFIFAFFFITYAYFWQGGGANQNVRIYLTRAIVEHATFSIDQYKEDAPDLEFVNTGDWAYYQGHYYSSKSPGLSLLAVPSYALSRYVLDTFQDYDRELRVVIPAYISHLATTVFLSAMLCVLMFHVCSSLLGLEANRSLLLTLAFGLGTLAFPYSTAFYGHQSASCFAFASLVAAFHVRRFPQEGRKLKVRLLALASGFAAGMAVLVEPQLALLSGAVFIYLSFFRISRGYLHCFVAGLLPAALVQLGYNYICFGNALASSYTYANPAVMFRVNGSAFSLPSMHSVVQLLVMPYRGLFYTSPVLLMCLAGAYHLYRDREWRTEALFCTAAVLSFFLFIASFHASFGGWAAGPRYLVPMFPWMFLLSTAAFEHFRVSYSLLATLSVFINCAITVVGSEIPSLVENPLREVVFPMLRAGMVSINPMPLLNFSSYPSLQELSDLANWPLLQNFNSFNLGEFIFPYRVESLLPLIVFWLLMSAVWVRLQRSKSHA